MSGSAFFDDGLYLYLAGNMFDFFISLFSDLSSSLFDPTKRIFIGYLVSAALIASVWLLVIQGKTFEAVRRQLWSSKVWLSRSARVDYSLLLINKGVMLLLSPYLLGQLLIATLLFEWLHHWSMPKPFEHWPVLLVITLFTLALFLLDDASRYLVHRYLHQSPTLWRFHQVHHTATNLTPFTIFRTHPVEGILFSLRSALVQGFCIGSFVFLFGSHVDVVTVFGVNILLFFFNITGSNLRHSPVSLPYSKAVERWLISPAQHQLHHSIAPEHFNKNYGVILSVWDRMGGTFHHSIKGSVLEYGVVQGDKVIQESLLSTYLRPFQENGKRLIKWGKSRLGGTG